MQVGTLWLYDSWATALQMLTCCAPGFLVINPPALDSIALIHLPGTVTTTSSCALTCVLLHKNTQQHLHFCLTIPLKRLRRDCPDQPICYAKAFGIQHGLANA